MAAFFTRLYHAILDVFFPRLCVVCGKAVKDDETEGICADCLADLPRTEQWLLTDNLTEELFQHQPHFSHAAAWLFFHKDTSVQHLIHAIKYREMPNLAYRLALVAAAEMDEGGFFDDIDVIIPVPLHPKRLDERGYNQSLYIARGISETTGIPVDTSHLLRVINNPKQALQSAGSRGENVKNAFEVNHPEELYRAHILLVDDVITTGSTLNACMDALQVVKAAKISCFALGKAR